MSWIPATAGAAIVIAPLFMLVRHRWGTKGLVVTAVLCALAIMGTCIALGQLEEGYQLFALVVIAASATTACAWAVVRFARAATVPDLPVELLVGVGGFLGGAIAGLVVSFYLVAMSVPRIG